MQRRRIPEPLIGLVLAVILMSLLFLMADRFHWFGDDPTFSGSLPPSFFIV